MIAFLQFARVLGGQLFSVPIEDHDRRQSELHRVSVARIDGGVVRFAVHLIHVDQDHDVMGRKFGGDGWIGFEKRVQPVAPAAPMGAKLQQHVLVLALRQFQGIGDLLRSIRPRVVDPRPLRALRLVGGVAPVDRKRQHAKHERQEDGKGLSLHFELVLVRAV